MATKIIPHPVFDRIRELYGLESDAAMARKLDIFPQDVPRQRKSGNIPYKQILSACPPEDWPFILLGLKSRQDPLEAVRATLLEKGYRMILEPLPAPQGPRGEAEG